MICDDDPEPYHLVVQSATSKTNVKSVLLTEWRWSAEYLVIHPSHIVGPCFVISIKDDSSKVLEAWPLEQWASEFTKPVEDALSSSSEENDEGDYADATVQARNDERNSITNLSNEESFEPAMMSATASPI